VYLYLLTVACVPPFVVTRSGVFLQRFERVCPFWDGMYVCVMILFVRWLNARY